MKGSYERMKESEKRAYEAAQKILEISSELKLGVNELDRAVEIVKNNTYLSVRPNSKE